MHSAHASNTLDSSLKGCHPPKKLICIAWAIEFVAILVSLSLAVHPVVTVQDSLLNGWLGAAPFLVIAVAEIAKIPLVEALFRMKGALLRSVAFFGIVVVCLNTFYTVSNGFERAHNAKTKNIQEVKREKRDAENEIRRIEEERARAQRSKEVIDQQLADINQREHEVFSDRGEVAKKLAEKGKTLSTTLTAAILKKYAEERATLLAQEQSLRVPLALSASDHIKARDDAASRLNALIYENQIYRFAAMVYGYDDPAQMPTKDLNTFCFVWFGLVAFAVSVLGPFLALCYYRIKYQDTRIRGAWDALLRSARRLLIRLARRNKIVKIEERHVETVIEKPVEVEVFRDVVHEVPVEKVVVQPVEVIREVPVDKVVVRDVEVVREVPVEKVVEKEVLREVPVDRIVPYEKLVEVEKKEIVYVPIFTNDPGILRAQAA